MASARAFGKSNWNRSIFENLELILAIDANILKLC